MKEHKINEKASNVEKEKEQGSVSCSISLIGFMT